MSLTPTLTGRTEVTAPFRDVILDVNTGRRGPIEDWVASFARVWEQPRIRLDELLALLDDNVTLRAPTIPPVSHGKAAARAAFERAFAGMPDLHADVHYWSASDPHVFVAMTFRATIGGHMTEWHNVDVVRFENGSAVERVAHFDPAPVRRAFLRNLSAIRQYWRLRRGVGGTRR